MPALRRARRPGASTGKITSDLQMSRSGCSNESVNYPRRAICPCCLFPTLNGRGAFEICVVCWWEDDGQSNQDADEVRGGPNSHYSLTCARRNFADHGHMYDMGQGIPMVEHPSAARSELVSYLQSIGFDPRRAEAMHLGKLLDLADSSVK